MQIEFSWSKETIEEETDKLMQDITQALDKVCPIKKLMLKSKPPSWWTTELHNLRRKVRNAEKAWKKLCSNNGANRENTLNKYEAYKSIRKDYITSIKKAKTFSWRSFTSNCVDIYQLNRIIFKKQINSISMMENCNTAEQTSKILLDAHFPGST